MRLLGNLAHRHGVPVTWLVTGASAEAERDLLTEFHEFHGDEVQQHVYLPGASSREEVAWLARGEPDELAREIASDRDKICEALPWAKGRVKVAGCGHRSNKLARVLLDLGYEGLYGHCPFQIGTDEITDWGTPWGAFYVGPEDYRVPRQQPGGLVTLEWTARDLNNALHWGTPEVFSTDPDDARRAGLCVPGNVKYWKDLFDQYLRNLAWNDHVFFQFHQEAHEMDHTVCPGMEPSWIAFDADLIDAFLDYAASKRGDAEFCVASDSVNLYRKLHDSTAPVVALFSRVLPEPGLPFWRQLERGKGYASHPTKHAQFPSEALYRRVQSVLDDPERGFRDPPWSDSLLYYDQQCLLAFDMDIPGPVLVEDFTRAGDKFHGNEGEGDGDDDVPWFLVDPPPAVEVERRPGGAEVRCKNPEKRATPFGVAVWGNFFDAGRVTCSLGETCTLRRMEERVVFVRFLLPPGTTTFRVSFERTAGER